MSPSDTRATDRPKGSTMSTTTSVSTCATTSCAFNHDGCHALAVTIGGSQGTASCGTFVTVDVRGGVAGDAGKVGACQRLECVHNTDLMCSADAITVGGDNALCETYQAR
ncbi:hypothetical protein MOPEL_009_00230 [Mobilicoccus pelagius NBRC 104925]|uniref:DUF1540 domain-containing protein n=2 Tax=Mobilicoccus TaxID=984996 RepID=H5UNM5_9MICO|nr:hypothetical protein MOPEL_009_00230 [Mobilicoccus pelagius NBRC 104925]